MSTKQSEVQKETDKVFDQFQLEKKGEAENLFDPAKIFHVPTFAPPPPKDRPKPTILREVEKIIENTKSEIIPRTYYKEFIKWAPIQERSEHDCGAMGIVFRATHTEPNGNQKHFAIKRFYPDNKDLLSFLIRINREKEKWIKLGPGEHEGICSFEGFLLDDPQYILTGRPSDLQKLYQSVSSSIVLSWCNGASFTEHHLGKRAGHLSPYSNLTYREMIRISLSLFKGLDTLHEKGIIHTDIASRNVMFHKNDETVKIQFGVQKDGQVKLNLAVKDGELTAKLIDIGDGWSEGEDPFPHRIWRAKEVRCPVDAPELRGLGEKEGVRFSPQSDIYSLGIVLVGMFLDQNLDVEICGDAYGYLAFSTLPLLREKLKPRDPGLNLYRLLEACIKLDPKERPSTKQIISYLTSVQVSILQREQLLNPNVVFEIEEEKPVKRTPGSSKDKGDQDEHSRKSACIVM